MGLWDFMISHDHQLVSNIIEDRFRRFCSSIVYIVGLLLTVCFSYIFPLNTFMLVLLDLGITPAKIPPSI